MSRVSQGGAIRLRGVRHNNLKNFDLDLPLRRLIVVTGLSGSGKSSLAFDTLFAEGQRRYIETFSPYARQFFDRMDKPRVDQIEGIPPAIAIEQRNTVRTTRSTVGTMTEICDYLKQLWPHLAQLHCRQCDRVVSRDTPQTVWRALPRNQEVFITFELPLSKKLSVEESLDLIARQGYQRLWFEETAVRLEEARERLTATGVNLPASLTVIQDRLKTAPGQRARFAEACEQAYHFGKGRLTVLLSRPNDKTERRRFSHHRHCPECDLLYREPSPSLFSFNHPLGACPTCHGFGRIISIDYGKALPDGSKTLKQGVVKPWLTGQSAECQQDLLRFCRKRKVPINVPFNKLPQHWQDWVIKGDPDYGKDANHEWPQAWYGVKGYFRWLESKSYKMHMRVLLSRYRVYTPCPDCHGRRFRPETLLYRVPLSEQTAATIGQSVNLAEFYGLTVQQALPLIRALAHKAGRQLNIALSHVLEEVQSRLAFLDEAGLGYLTLDRPTRSLSGGETERVNLTTCLGTQLVSTLYVLDEPSVGLHARDTGRLVRILERLRDLGNTVVVVEHEARVIRAADTIVDLGPGHGEQGGHVVFQGSFPALLKSRRSLTGKYLSGRRTIDPLPRRPVNLGRDPHLAVQGANRHNLRELDVQIPLNRLVCVTGVSGSGKTTLVREVLFPLLREHLQSEPTPPMTDDAPSPSDESALSSADHQPTRLSGAEQLGRVLLVDQSPLGRTPRSNPALYSGAFDDIRQLFAKSEAAQQRGLETSAFSFNSTHGQCERCRGAGFEKIEMQFLSDVFIRCPECDGRRYRAHVLEVRLQSQSTAWSIADVLGATVEDAIIWLKGISASTPAIRAIKSLELLQEVGLGYLRLGQPLNTLSGGESQRLKLVGQLAEFVRSSRQPPKPTLFLLDEPTTGLHFDDIRVLLAALQRLVQAGHSVVVIEHNLDVIKCADWVIDLGPEAGAGGGQLVMQGPPETIATCRASHTGRALQEEKVRGRSA